MCLWASLVVLTHSCQATGTFTYCGAAANQADDKEKSPDSDYYNGWNQSVHVFKEMVVVVVCDEHIRADVA